MRILKMNETAIDIKKPGKKTDIKLKIEVKKENQVQENLVPIFIMGKKYNVPASLTIQKALEYAGYQLIRGCGCRGGICGACATVFRYPNSYRIEVGLACQTVVQPDMYIAQIPFFPGNKAIYNLKELEPTGSVVAALYPEIFKCIGCGTCTRSCPMDLDVMGIISKIIRGDIAGAAELSFDCVMCGICSARCPAEEVQYNVEILTRRLYGRYLAPQAKHVTTILKVIDEGGFRKDLNNLIKMNREELEKAYNEREIEPDMADEFWEPKDKKYIAIK
jgi:heterodisulfide reductase subunit C